MTYFFNRGHVRYIRVSYSSGKMARLEIPQGEFSLSDRDLRAVQATQYGRDMLKAMKSKRKKKTDDAVQTETNAAGE